MTMNSLIPFYGSCFNSFWRITGSDSSVNLYQENLLFCVLLQDISVSIYVGVKEERLSEGLAPRHCALSLVGEPIMYPEINSLVEELHRRRLSTFLVTNAQFPEKIMLLKPVTQVCVCAFLSRGLSTQIFLYSL